jgi:predicted dehydrogenase
MIVGCGAVIQRIYKRPLEQLDKRGELRVVGLVDSNIRNAETVQTSFPGARVFGELASALTALKTDLMIVSSPAAFHADHTLQALQNGSHVLCEKPLAPSVEQCEEMIQAAHARGLLLGVEMTRRFYPSLARLRSMIASEELESPLSFIYREGGQYNWPVMSTASFHRETGGGGVLADKGSHVFDTILSLFGPFSVLSYQDDAMIGGVEATCLIQIKNEKVEGTIQLSWDQELNNEFKVCGPRQEVVLDPGSMDDIRIGNRDGHRRFSPGITFPVSAMASNAARGAPKTYDDCIYYQLVQVLRAIQLQEPLPVTGREGARVISAISECYRIAEPVDMPWLSPKQAETYRRLHWKRAQ